MKNYLTKEQAEEIAELAKIQLKKMKEDSRIVGVKEIHKKSALTKIQEDNKQIVIIPNMLFRSNYFICPTCYVNYDKYIGLELYNEPKKDKSDLFYFGVRGTILDARVYAAFFTLAKDNIGERLIIPERKILEIMGITATDTVAREKIRMSFLRLHHVSFFFERNQMGINLRLFGGGSFAYPLKYDPCCKKEFICEIPEESLVLLDRNFNQMDMGILSKCATFPYVSRLYMFLTTNKENPHMSLNQLVSMIDPFAKDKKELVRAVRYRTIPKLVDLGILKDDGIEYDKSKNRITFKFKNRLQEKVCVQNKRHGGVVLKRRSLATIEKMDKIGALKNGIKEKTDKDLEVKYKRKDDVNSIVDYWESKGLPKFKIKNNNNKTYKKAILLIGRALRGDLYKGTQWEKHNRKFSVKDFTFAIDEYTKYVYKNSNKNKSNLPNFLFPPEGMNITPNFIPTFLLNLSGAETPETETKYEQAFKYAVTRWKHRTKNDRIPQDTLNILALLTNKIEDNAMFPYFAKQATDEEIEQGKRTPVCRLFTGKGYPGPVYRDAVGPGRDIIFEIAFDIMLNYKEQGYDFTNDKGIYIVKQLNFISILSNRISWIRRGLKRGNIHPKYQVIPLNIFKEEDKYND